MIKNIEIGSIVLIETESFTFKGKVVSFKEENNVAIVSSLPNQSLNTTSWIIRKRNNGYWGCDGSNGYLKIPTIKSIEALT